MKGYRTFITALVSIIGGLLTMLGVTVPDGTLDQLAGSLDVVIGAIITLYGVVMLLLRAITRSPMFKQPADVVPDSSGQSVFKSWLVVVCALVLAACGAMPTPQSTEQRVAYVDASLTGAVNSAATLVETGAMSIEDADWFASRAAKARVALQATKRHLRDQQPQQAQTQLEVARDLLIELNRFLTEKRGKP